MVHITKIAHTLKINSQQVAATVGLLDADNTIPFIARYRKEVTGGLDEEQIRAIRDILGTLRILDERRKTVLKTIQDQGNLTPELKTRIEAVGTRTELEDIYQPYKPRRATRASIARQRGLGPLADLILQQAEIAGSLDLAAKPFLNEDVPTVEAAWSGARDIAAETISDHTKVRTQVRDKAAKWATQTTNKIKTTEDPRGTYKDYYDFEFKIDRLRPHQVLAINRGEAEKVLRVRLDIPERDWRQAIDTYFPVDHRSPLANQLTDCAEDGAGRLLLPAIGRDLRRQLTTQAESHAIQVFATNLRNLLNQPPLADFVVMGIDPGFRTGCKVAVVDPTGKSLDTATIYPHPPQKLSDKARQILAALIAKHGVSLIAIGNGTASRETEQLAASLIGEMKTSNLKGTQLHYMIVSEAGASVYSASALARSELPDMDVSMRGAVSIARRVQDPLSELVKIDPKSIGIGMYQHDVDQKKLGAALDEVVESVVNQTGVDLNSASPALLTYVSGIGPTLAARIVEYRDRHGPFNTRRDLLNVKGLGPKAFEQSAGFLRIRNGRNPLDRSAIHPESYPIAKGLLRRAGLGMEIPPEARHAAMETLRTATPLAQLAKELGTGVPTLEDIFVQLIRPGRDPRQDLPAPILRSDVLKMEDLVEGMLVKGTIRNVVDFGAFVDIGVKHDGLLHRSQVPRGTNLSLGEVIEVTILKVEAERGRISLGWPDLSR